MTANKIENEPDGGNSLTRFSHITKQFLATPDGKFWLNMLDKTFGGTAIVLDKEKRVDPNATLTRAGAQEVLIFIKGIGNVE
jgi:hypothetical protein